MARDLGDLLVTNSKQGWTPAPDPRGGGAQTQGGQNGAHKAT